MRAGGQSSPSSYLLSTDSVLKIAELDRGAHVAEILNQIYVVVGFELLTSY